MNVQATPRVAVDPAEMSDVDNTIPIEAWNTVLFEKFCRFRHVLSHGLAGHSDDSPIKGRCGPPVETHFRLTQSASSLAR